MNELIYASATALARAIRAKEVSATEAVHAYLQRIEEVNPALNAVVQLCAEAPQTQARAADAALARGQIIGPLHGVLFDLPHVVQDAACIASERLTLQAGDFCKDTLPVCDAYLVMEVIHAWGDEEAVATLQAIRRSAPVHAKVLLIEQMVPDDPGPHWSKMLDIHMLALLGGRQRTRQEYAVLFDSAGFSYQREVDTGTDISILEAVPA